MASPGASHNNAPIGALCPEGRRNRYSRRHCRNSRRKVHLMPHTRRKIIRSLALGAAAALVTVAALSVGSAHAKEKNMVVEYIRYEIPGPQHDAFLTAYRAAGSDLAAAPECLRYEIAEGVEEPDNFVVRIEWQSRDAHEHGFRRGPHFGPFFAKVKPFFSNIREMKHYEVAAEGKGGSAAAAMR
jgi:quinol monooxygenase YgiN